MNAPPESLPGEGVGFAAAVLSALIAFGCWLWAVRVLRRGEISPEAKSTAARLLVLAITSIAIVPLLAVYLTEAARADFIAALHGTGLSPDEVASALARALAISQISISFGFVVLWLPPLFVAVAGCVLLTAVLWTPLPAEDARAKTLPWWALTLSAVAWTYGCVALPVALCAKYSSDLGKVMGAIGGLTPFEKENALLAQIDDGYTELVTRLLLSYSAVAVATIAGVIWVVVREDRAHAQPRRVNREWLAGAGCLVVAAVLLLLTTPRRAENADPIPEGPVAGSGSFNRPKVNVPDLQSVDPIEATPLLELDNRRLWLDGRPIEVNAIAGDLGILRRNWQLLYPGQAFPGIVSVLGDSSTAAVRVHDALAEAHCAGYSKARLLVGAMRTFDRPLLGKLERARFSAAELLLAPSDAPVDKDVVEIEAKSFANYEALARSVVETRTLYEPIALRLSSSAAAQ